MATIEYLRSERYRLQTKLKSGKYTPNDLRRNQHSFDMKMLAEIEDKLAKLDES